MSVHPLSLTKHSLTTGRARKPLLTYNTSAADDFKIIKVKIYKISIKESSPDY